MSDFYLVSFTKMAAKIVFAASYITYWSGNKFSLERNARYVFWCDANISIDWKDDTINQLACSNGEFLLYNE